MFWICLFIALVCLCLHTKEKENKARCFLEAQQEERLKRQDERRSEARRYINKQ